MNRRKLLIRLTSLILFIFFLNYAAMKFYWYSSLWWLDMPIHFLGGFWVGLLSVWLFPPQNMSFKSVFKVSLMVFLVGFLWEIFEIAVNDTLIHNPFNMLDTSSDLLFDLAGGLSAVIYFFKRIMFTSQIKI